MEFMFFLCWLDKSVAQETPIPPVERLALGGTAGTGWQVNSFKVGSVGNVGKQRGASNHRPRIDSVPHIHLQTNRCHHSPVRCPVFRHRPSLRPTPLTASGHPPSDPARGLRLTPLAASGHPPPGPSLFFGPGTAANFRPPRKPIYSPIFPGFRYETLSLTPNLLSHPLHQTFSRPNLHHLSSPTTQPSTAAILFSHTTSPFLTNAITFHLPPLPHTTAPFLSLRHLSTIPFSLCHLQPFSRTDRPPVLSTTDNLPPTSLRLYSPIPPSESLPRRP
ncbi:hypothetical protein QBC39DRAFT_184326 [Podospora conica]|nr:hypothetical protein QBC39DRAFT_184326 [Schizothecium conicum]